MGLIATKKTDSFISQLEDMKEYIGDIINKKQESYDTKSEKWQESEKGEELQAEISNLGELLESIETTIDKFNETFEMA